MTVHVFGLIRRIQPRWMNAITEAAKKHGWNSEIWGGTDAKIKQGDILVTWNRHMDQDQIARQFEGHGGRVICLENAYLKPKNEINYVSVGLGFHNNIEHSPKCLDNGERFAALNLEIKPWRTEGSHILFPTQAKQYNQRGLGWRDYCSPQGCDDMLIRMIRKKTKRKILFRIHPNSMDLTAVRMRLAENVRVSNCSYERHPIQDDLQNCWATCIWSSNAATESLLEGIPVFVCGPGVYMMDACNKGLDALEGPLMPSNRLSLFNRMAWSQFSEEEVRNGFIFECLFSP